MSRYHGNGKRCPTCGITYGELRTGLTYREVFGMLMDNEDDPARWRYKRRGTVLGHWHQMKKSLWALHQYECREQRRYDEEELEREAIQDELKSAQLAADGVPF